MHITGTDLDNMIEEIETNGGAGEWETPTGTQSIERWSFPRHPGATDPASMYLSRPGLGPYDTDVETVAAWLDAPRNVVGGVMLLGEPGTGKSALAQAACTHAEREITFITATPDDTKDSLFLRFVGEGNGVDSTPFVLGQVPYAVLNGHTLIVDEFYLFADGLKPVFYNLMDGSHYLPGGNVDGSAMEVHPDFRILITSNPKVRGASLPEPIGSRLATTTLTIETSEAMLRDLGIADEIVEVWLALGQQGLWRPQIREMRMADYWLNVDITQASSAFLPEHAPESQREAIRATVLSILGGDLGVGGRLVVS